MALWIVHHSLCQLDHMFPLNIAARCRILAPQRLVTSRNELIQSGMVGKLGGKGVDICDCWRFVVLFSRYHQSPEKLTHLEGCFLLAVCPENYLGEISSYPSPLVKFSGFVTNNLIGYVICLEDLSFYLPRQRGIGLLLPREVKHPLLSGFQNHYKLRNSANGKLIDR